MSDTRKTLHQEVVEGIVRVIRHIHIHKKGTFSELVTVGRGEGFQNDYSSMFVFEFIKDGCVNLRKEDIEKVISGDYSDIWHTTNTFLRAFGHAPVDPCSISP